ncbi:MAG: hypothetical protein WAO89_08865, partial [Kiritimatiellia bacterium]
MPALMLNEEALLMRCDSFVLGGLLGSLSLLVLGGLGALLIGRMSSRSAVRLGMGTAVAGCL